MVCAIESPWLVNGGHGASLSRSSRRGGGTYLRVGGGVGGSCRLTVGGAVRGLIAGWTCACGRHTYDQNRYIHDQNRGGNAWKCRGISATAAVLITIHNINSVCATFACGSSCHCATAHQHRGQRPRAVPWPGRPGYTSPVCSPPSAVGESQSRLRS
eukprot:COSAG01_NODE_20612_length_945_cov_1.074468_1_plen_157_part_00